MHPPKQPTSNLNLHMHKDLQGGCYGTALLHSFLTYELNNIVKKWANAVF